MQFHLAEIAGLISRGTSIGVCEVVGAHDPLEGVVVREVEGRGQLVVVVVLVCEHVAAAAVVPLVVVVVDEGQGAHAVQHVLHTRQMRCHFEIETCRTYSYHQR